MKIINYFHYIMSKTNKYYKLFFVIWFILFLVVFSTYPSKKDFPKREAILFENIPDICLYDNNVKLKENLKVYTSGITPCAKGVFFTNKKEKEVVAFYESELQKFDWDKFILFEERSVANKWNMKSREYKSKNHLRQITTWLIFDDSKNKNNELYYKVSFQGDY